jgi:small-conductance mechanosensitive channel
MPRYVWVIRATNKKERILLEFLELRFWNNTILDYLIFIGSLAVSVVVLLIVKRIALRRLAARAKKTPTSLDAAIVKSVKRYILPLLYLGALYLNTKWLTLSDQVSHAVNIAALAVLMMLGAVVISSILVYTINKYLENRQKPGSAHAIRWIGGIIRVIVWIGVLLWFLDILEIPITTMVAGLGIGGIAVAFAAQAIIADVFSFVTIFFDRPFEIGDFIEVDTLSGTVEHIGVKTTRVRSLSGEQLVFSNKDLTGARLHNYKRMEARRVLFTLGVTYDTPAETLKAIPMLLREIIDGVDQTRFDRAHFKKFADFSLVFEVVYYVLSQDFALYMDVQQTINLAVKEAFDSRGIEFAFPTQTLYMQSADTDKTTPETT